MARTANNKGAYKRLKTSPMGTKNVQVERKDNYTGCK